MSFLDILANKGALDRYAIDDVLEKVAETDMSIDEVLDAQEIDPDIVRAAKSEFFNIPEAVIDPDAIRYESLRFIPEASARLYQAIAFDVTPEGVVKVGLVDPGNSQVINALQFIFSKNQTPYELFVISYKDFKDIMQTYVQSPTSLSGDSEESIGGPLDSIAEDQLKDLETILEDADAADQSIDKNMIVEDAPIAKRVGVILINAIDGGASDIHIEHTSDNVRVRVRVDGELHTSYTLPKEVRNMVVARVKILANLKLDERRKPQDGRFFAKVHGRKVDFRVSTMPTAFGEKVVIRILDPGRGIGTLDETGMTAFNLETVRKMIKRPYGMILITGPTGSGKSTTLYSMLQELDRETHNVVSLEDPIEYNINGVNQSQVRPEIGYTFANGLRSILRQDPDIIMVGEIRDKETAELAIQAALTGHLVFSTLHTNTSIGAVPRLIDMGIDPYLIAPTLIMTMGQRLARRICDDAAIQNTDPGVQGLISKQFEDLPQRFREALPLNQPVHDAQPTASCPVGTKGRVGVFEVLEIDDEIERMILNSPTEQDIYELARSRGFITMKEDGIFKSMQGLIPWSEVNKL
ncbi:type II/IV secretion system protein [Candidatus Nomurabacteria bacterium]|nr:type II/IV secretion system protein [Candidatus Nomurabacteria bacterium]